MENLEFKQAIVVRNDLRSKLRHGKLAAQCCHASMASFLTGMEIHDIPNSSFQMLNLKMENERYEWISGSFGKVILRCEDEAELLTIRDKCLSSGKIPHALITDHGRTVFHEPTITCLGIGPLSVEMLNHLTGHLKLY